MTQTRAWISAPDIRASCPGAVHPIRDLHDGAQALETGRGGRDRRMQVQIMKIGLMPQAGSISHMSSARQF